MRCTLALCVVMAFASSAWSAEQDTASAALTQNPAVTAAAPVIQATGSPTMPTVSPSGVYQTTTTSPTTTAPMMMSPGTYVTGTTVTTYSTPASSNMYYYPAYNRGGPLRRLFRIFQPMNGTPTMAATPAYGSGYVTYGTVPTQTALAPIMQTNYSPVPTQVGSAPIMQTTPTPAMTYTPSQQVTYMPARRGLFGLGLFQGRRRQLANPMYTTTAPMNYYYYTVPPGTQATSAPTTASAPAGTSPTTTAPRYQETQFTAPATTAPAPSLPSATTPSTTTPPAPPIPQVRTPRGTL
jgi:hypothetical protein